MQLLFMRLALIFISVACLLCVVGVVVAKVSQAKREKADTKAVNETSQRKLRNP